MHRHIVIASLLLSCSVSTSLRGQDHSELDRDAVRQAVKRQLQDADPEVRKSVVYSVKHAWAAAEDPRVLRMLLEAMASDVDPSVRREFADKLYWWPNRNLPPRHAGVQRTLLRATRDAAAEVRYVALHFIARMQFCDQAVLDRLGKLLGDKDAKMRWRAARTLGRLGPAAEPAVPKLLGLIDDVDYACRQEAIGALGKIGREPKAVVPALLAALGHADPLVRADAAQALGRIGFPDALPAVDALQWLVEGVPDDVPAAEQPRLRASAGFALAAMGDIDDTVFEALAVPVSGEDQDLRKETVMLIAELGPKAARLVPLLMAQLEVGIDFSNPRRFRTYLPIEGTVWITDGVPVPWALSRIGPPALQPLTAALSDSSWYVRDHAAWALCLMGPKAKGAVPFLQRLLHDDELIVRNSARDAIYHILAVETDVESDANLGVRNQSP